MVIGRHSDQTPTLQRSSNGLGRTLYVSECPLPRYIRLTVVTDTRIQHRQRLLVRGVISDSDSLLMDTKDDRRRNTM